MRSAIVGGLVLLFLLPARVYAGGYLLVTDTGIPYKWGNGTVSWNPDGGGLGVFWTNPDAIAYTQAALDRWVEVPTTDLSIVNAGPLPPGPGFDGDVNTVEEFSQFFLVADGLSPVVFDEDGTLFDQLFGAGTGVLGFTAIEVVTGSAPFEIREAFQAYNGRWIDGNPANSEFPLGNFAAVITHEFGHFQNLDHAQVNGQYHLGDTDDPGFALHGPPPVGSATMMFPFLFGDGRDTFVPLADDVAWISSLYPSPSFAARSSISGTVFANDGTTLFQGANVIARNPADPFLDAISNVSGYQYFPDIGIPGGSPPPGSEGAYLLPNLTPGADYTLEVTRVNPRFTGGSGVGPVPPAVITFEEFHNGSNEAGFDPPDDPLAAVPVAANGQGGVDFVLNAIFDPNEPNGGAGDCTPVEVGGSLTGALDPPFEQDWFCFSGSPGRLFGAEVVAFRNDSGLDPTLTLIDGDGSTVLAYDDDSFGLDPGLRTCLPAPGTYYLVVRSFAGRTAGSYDLVLTDPGPADPEPNGNAATAVPLPDGCPVSLTGCLNPAGDGDFYAFSARAGVPVQIDMDTLDPLRSPDSHLTLYGPDGVTVLGTDDDGGPGLDAEVVFTPDADGTYYVECRTSPVADSLGTGLYTVTLRGPERVTHGNGHEVDGLAGGEGGWSDYAPAGLGGDDHLFDGHFGFTDGSAMDDGDDADFSGACLGFRDHAPGPEDERTADFLDPARPLILTGSGSGLEVEQTTFHNDFRAGGAAAHWTLVVARVVNRTGEAKPVRWYKHLDPDVKPLFSDDDAGFDASRNLVYQHNAGGEGPYVGLGLVSGSLVNHQINSFGGPGTPDNNSGYGEEARLAFVNGMNGGDRSAPGPGDRSVSLAADLGTIPDGESAEIRFVVCGGSTLDDLRADYDDARFWSGSVLATPGPDIGVSGLYLAPNRPNPFGSATRFSFRIPGGDGPVPTLLQVFDVRGRLVRTLVDGDLPPGDHEAFWDGTGSGGARVTAGVYFTALKAGGAVRTRKLVVLEQGR